MSEAPHGNGALIKTPGQLIIAIIAGFAIPIIVILLLANYVDDSARTGAGTDLNANIVQRIAPLAQLNFRDASAPRVYRTGEQVYQAVCSTCHATGLAGAPKFGNASDWAPRIAQGFDTLWHTALAGKGAMPARGGTSPDDYSDYEVGRAIVYMANHGGAQFAEPPAPAAKSAAAPGSAPEDSAGAAAIQAQAAAAIAALTANPATTATTASPPASADAAQVGKALYTQICQTCHATGLMNAPKFGDKAAWAPRLKDPIETIYHYAIMGKGVMPPKGGSTASDAEVKAAVDYMISAVK